MTTLADLVRQYRSDARLSQEGLADRAGVSMRTVSDIECGVALAPRAMTLELLAQALALADDEKERLRAVARRKPAAAVAAAVAPAVTPFRLAALPPELIGRDAEIAAAAALLRRTDVRLVTFLGGAGCGKTSLALAAAHAAADAFAGGALFVELGAVPDPSFVPTKIAFAAQVRDARGESTAETIAAAFGGRRTLLLLDTCEHVAGVAPFLAELLAHAGGLTIAATSRAPLRIAAEVEFAVRELAVPPANEAALATLEANPTVALLVDRVRLLDPDFRVTPRNAAGIAELARLTEGIPLAVTLAAPLLATMSPAAFVGQFERRLPLLATGNSDLPQRQRTMRDAIGWSYELLSEDERRVFRRLAVCRGPFGAELAHAVAGEPDTDLLETLRVVAVLVDQSLLQVIETDDEPRFVALDLVREFAAEALLQSGEHDAMHRRLAAYATAAAGGFRSGLPTPQTRLQFDRLARESATFDAVLTWARRSGDVDAGLRLAVTLWDFWWFSGSFAQGAAWLQALLARVEDGALADEELLARAYTAAAGLTEARGAYREGEVLARKALPLKRKLGDLVGVASLLSGMGVAASERGEYARARELLGEGLAIRRTLGNDFLVGKSLFDLAQNAANEDDVAAARRWFDEALTCFRSADSTLGVAFVFAHLGLVAARCGQAEQAETFSREAQRMGEAIGHQGVIVQARQNLAFAALLRGACAEAEGRFRDVLATMYATDLGTTAPEAIEGLAAAVAGSGRAAEAAVLLGTAQAWRERCGLHVYPAVATEHERLAASVRAALGEPMFAAHVEVGRAARGAAAYAVQPQAEPIESRAAP